MSRYCVIGSGISGATIANLLSKKNLVDLFDKARGPGGRSSFKRLDKAKGFDHGTQYISPKSLAFKRFVNDLIKKHETNFKGVGQPIRVALTGSKFGPGLYDIIISLGKEEVEKRLSNKIIT